METKCNFAILRISLIILLPFDATVSFSLFFMLSERLLTFDTEKVTVFVLASDIQLVFSFGSYTPYYFCHTEI